MLLYCSGCKDDPFSVEEDKDGRIKYFLCDKCKTNIIGQFQKRNIPFSFTFIPHDKTGAPNKYWAHTNISGFQVQIPAPEWLEVGKEYVLEIREK